MFNQMRGYNGMMYVHVYVYCRNLTSHDSNY